VMRVGSGTLYYPRNAPGIAAVERNASGRQK
jgi:hypothetical protein